MCNESRRRRWVERAVCATEWVGGGLGLGRDFDEGGFDWALIYLSTGQDRTGQTSIYASALWFSHRRAVLTSI